jgi:hypothetical protein
MSNVGTPFFITRRGGTNLSTTFPSLYASKVGGHALVRRAAANVHVSGLAGHVLTRRTGANVHVSRMGGHILFRQATLVQLFSRNTTATGARTARASWGTVGGDVYMTNASGLYAFDYAWLQAGLVGDYEIRATVIAGFNPTAGDLIDTWLSLSTNREWRYQVSGRSKYIDGTIRFDIRDTATSTIQATCTVFFTSYTDGGVFV